MNAEEKAMQEIEKNIVKPEKKANKALGFIKGNLSKIAIAPIALVYIFYGVFKLSSDRTGQTIAEIIGNIAVALITGILIYYCFMNSGLSDAKKSQVYVDKVNEFYTTKESVILEVDKLSAYCSYSNEREIKEERKNILQAEMLKYSSYEIGYYDLPEVKAELTEEQLKAIEKAKNTKIVPLNARDLLNTSNGLSKKKQQKYGKFGRSNGDYIASKTTQSILWSVTWSIVFGYYTLTPFFEGSAQEIFATMLWNLLQVIMWLGWGAMKYMDAKSFITEEYLENNIVNKTTYLKEFKAILNNKPELLQPYLEEDEQALNEYIAKKEEEEKRRIEALTKKKPIIIPKK